MLFPVRLNLNLQVITLQAQKSFLFILSSASNPCKKKRFKKGYDRVTRNKHKNFSACT